jgi:hypothetical protein
VSEKLKIGPIEITGDPWDLVHYVVMGVNIATALPSYYKLAFSGYIYTNPLWLAIILSFGTALFVSYLGFAIFARHYHRENEYYRNEYNQKKISREEFDRKDQESRKAQTWHLKRGYCSLALSFLLNLISFVMAVS